MVELNQYIKTLISNITFLSKDVLHVYGGVFFVLLWLIIFKQRKQYLCVAILIILSVVNEVLDISYTLGKANKIYWGESCSDIFNTIFLPIILLVFVKVKTKWSNLIG